jgi:hypothetical protein
MDECEFDSLQLQPWDRQKSERFNRLILWLSSMTSNDLQRQLLAPSPELPAGYGLADFRRLEQHAEAISVALAKPNSRWMSDFLGRSAIADGILITLEARRKVIRRAIEYLEGQN